MRERQRREGEREARRGRARERPAEREMLPGEREAGSREGAEAAPRPPATGDFP